MKIEKIKIEEIRVYENNAKLHPAEQIEQIKKSIKEFGFNDPIAVDENNMIIEGHGRYFALKELEYNEVECIRLDHLTEQQKKAYILAHNKLTMNTDFDLDILSEELDNILDINMTDFGFDLDFNADDLEDESKSVLTDEKYTTKVDIPQYQMTGEEPEINELCKEDKTKELIKRIKASNVTDEQKEFLIKSAQRHLVFNYAKIAEYYAHQNKEMQELMEESALIIIDYDDAIKNGYMHLKSEIEQLEGDEYEE